MFDEQKLQDRISRVQGDSEGHGNREEPQDPSAKTRESQLHVTKARMVPGSAKKEKGDRAPGEEVPLSDALSLNRKTSPSLVRDPRAAVPTLSEQQLLEAITRFIQYLQEERARYYLAGRPLSREKTGLLKRFFRPALLARVRIVELAGRRIPNPSFYPEARAMGFVNLPDISHKASLTFLDVVVFNEKATERDLFHALVHAAQVRVLGIDRYVTLFIRGFLRTKSYSLIPIKAHAFALDARFAENPAADFSVEKEIQRWLKEDRY